MYRDDEFLYLLLFVIFAFLGLFYKYTFFVLQLPYVVAHTLGKFAFVRQFYDSVYNAIFSKLSMLILVMFLGLIYIFIFSIVSFESYV